MEKRAKAEAKRARRTKQKQGGEAGLEPTPPEVEVRTPDEDPENPEETHEAN